VLFTCVVKAPSNRISGAK